MEKAATPNTTLIVQRVLLGVKSSRHATMLTNLVVLVNLRDHHPNQRMVRQHRNQQQHLHPKRLQRKKQQASRTIHSIRKCVFVCESKTIHFIWFENVQSHHATKTRIRTKIRIRKLRRKHKQQPQPQHRNHHQMMVCADKKVSSATKKTVINSIVALTMAKAV